MAEYIDRDLFLKNVKHNAPHIYYMVEPIALITTAADVAQVRHGRWIEQEKYTFGVMYDCSICGNRILDTGHSWNYCTNCGARMDGVHDG